MRDAHVSDPQTALLRLPFDHYARYRLTADLLREAAGDLGDLHVLDVGGGPGSLAAFLPQARVVGTDVALPEPQHRGDSPLVVADGARLPVADAAVDAVVSLDTLEHVPPDQRETLLREVARTARRWVVIACPCATPGVAEADAAVREFVRGRFGSEHYTVRILTEHLEYGHPDPERVRATLQDAGLEVEWFPSGLLDRWVPMMLLFFHLMNPGWDEADHWVQSWYNARFYRDDLRAPAYRQAFFARWPGTSGPSPSEVATRLRPDGDAAPAPSAAFAALREGLTQELVEVADRQRLAVADLERRLRAVSDRAEQLEAELAATRAHAAELERFRDRVVHNPAVRLVRRFRGRG